MLRIVFALALLFFGGNHLFAFMEPPPPPAVTAPQEKKEQKTRGMQAKWGLEIWDVSGRYKPGPGPRGQFKCLYPGCHWVPKASTREEGKKGALSAHMQWEHGWRDPVSVLADQVQPPF